MDEAIDTNSFDTTENSDILPDTSDDIGSLMDEVPLDTNSIEELDIEENSLENEPEIEKIEGTASRNPSRGRGRGRGRSEDQTRTRSSASAR